MIMRFAAHYCQSEHEEHIMRIPLTQADVGKPLTIHKMANPELGTRLGRMGLFEGSEILRLDQEVLVQPVRVRGPGGDAVIGGGMAMKIVVHLPDDRRLPLIEMQPRQSGHIEGLTGGVALLETLETLGLKPDDPILFIRRLPPMEYVVITEGGNRVRLTEGMAAKIWGRMGGRSMQLVSARTSEPFEATRIMGGHNARRMLRDQGIEQGAKIRLEGVARAQSLQLTTRNPVGIATRQGLRLFLEDKDANEILVRPVAERIAPDVRG
jgi:Fe2+ transport system protein FeoA